MKNLRKLREEYAKMDQKPFAKWSENDMLKLSDNKQTAFKIARRRLESIIAREIDTLTVDDLQAVINKECKSYYTARDVKTLLSHLYKRAMASNTKRKSVIAFPEFLKPVLIEKRQQKKPDKPPFR